ncbi:MAG: protein tyrosine kinase modulator, partial [Candidatus Binatota bacterium]|nr:protein tyrosine kinase modulator [Candidatus Binatota bacterium]
MASRASRDGLDTAVEIVQRRMGLAIFTFAALFAAAVSLIVFLPDIYRATATLLVERQQVPEDFVRSTVTSAVDSRLQTISQEILSRSRLQKLIRDLDLYQALRGEAAGDEVLDRMRKDIQLETREVAQLGENQATIAFAVSYSGSDPRKVAQVTNMLASFYIEENLKVRAKQATGTAEFLETELDKIKQKLDEQERLVSKFKEEHMGELPEQREANLSTLERLNSQLRLNGYQQVRAREQRAALTKQLSDAGKGRTRREADPVAARLAKMKQDLAELRSNFSEKYPDVVRLKAEIAALEKRRSAGGTVAEGEGARSPYSMELQQSLKAIGADLAGLKAEEKGVRESIAEYQRRVENAPRREQEFQALSRDYETTKDSYRSLLKRYK